MSTYIQLNRPLASIWRLDSVSRSSGRRERLSHAFSGTLKPSFLLRKILAGTVPRSAFLRMYFLERTPPSTFQPAWKDRIRFITKLVNDYSVDGVIWYQLSFDEVYDLECSVVAKSMDEMNIPFLKLESSYEYSREAVAPLTTRIESFLEPLGRKRSHLR